MNKDRNKAVSFLSASASDIALSMATLLMYTGLMYTGVAFSDGIQHTVFIRNVAFDPPQLKVSIGDTVEWINDDFVPHTTTANDSSWDSGLIATQKSWRLVVKAEMSGDYYCVYHPGMKGNLTIMTE
ncbi:MAG: copper-binding protein [Gammaproteobacteria bacterium]|nr:copper-binding protein [Gammaproteobacteria bacterium]